MEIFGDYITLTEDTEIHTTDAGELLLNHKDVTIYLWSRGELSELIDALMAFHDSGDFTKVD